MFYATDGWAKDDLVYEWIPQGPVQVLLIINMMNMMFEMIVMMTKTRRIDCAAKLNSSRKIGWILLRKECRLFECHLGTNMDPDGFPKARPDKGEKRTTSNILGLVELLMRSLWLEKFSNIWQIFQLQIYLFLAVKRPNHPLQTLFSNFGNVVFFPGSIMMMMMKMMMTMLLCMMMIMKTKMLWMNFHSHFKIPRNLSLPGGFKLGGFGNTYCDVITATGRNINFIFLTNTETNDQDNKMFPFNSTQLLYSWFHI